MDLFPLFGGIFVAAVLLVLFVLFFPTKTSGEKDLFIDWLIQENRKASSLPRSIRFGCRPPDLEMHISSRSDARTGSLGKGDVISQTFRQAYGDEGSDDDRASDIHAAYVVIEYRQVFKVSSEGIYTIPFFNCQYSYHPDNYDGFISADELVLKRWQKCIFIGGERHVRMLSQSLGQGGR